MSGESYGYVYVPPHIPTPEELAKLESERLRKEAEQRLQIETEKTKVVLERMTKERERIRENEKRVRKAHQAEERRWDLEKTLLNDKSVIKKAKARKITSKTSKESADKYVDSLSKLQSIELKISDLDPAISNIIHDELIDIKNALHKIKGGEIRGNSAYFESNLKWLDIRLKEIIKKGVDKLEAAEKELDALQNETIELLTDIELIVCSPLMHDKDRALQLKAELESALSNRNIDRCKVALETLTPELKKLQSQYLEMEKQNDERRYIMGSVQSVLTDMGYEVSKIPDKTAEISEAPLFLESTIPNGGGIRLGFGMDKGIFAEVFHLENREISNEQFKKQEQKWCSDIDKLKEKLKEKRIIFDDKWRKDFTDEEIDTIIRSKTIENSNKEEEFRRRMIQDQRRMNR